jgi:hypothetical protein
VPKDRDPLGIDRAAWLIPISAIGLTFVVFMIGAGLSAVHARLALPSAPNLAGLNHAGLRASPMGVFIVGLSALLSWWAAWTASTWWRARGAYKGAKAGLPGARAAMWAALWIMFWVLLLVFVALLGLVGLVPHTL